MFDQNAPEADDQREDVAAASDLERKDVELGAKLAKHREHPVAKAAGDASKVGDQGPLYTISAAVMLAGVVGRDRRVARSGIFMLAAVGLADVTKRIVKAQVRRTRPHVLLDEDRYAADGGGSPRKPEQSFPSGHTACSAAAARALSREYPKTGIAAGVAAVAIGIARIAKGAHWPLDVCGGAIIGLAAEAVSHALITHTPPFSRRESS
jgi:hypothetical protein